MQIGVLLHKLKLLKSVNILNIERVNCFIIQTIILLADVV